MKNEVKVLARIISILLSACLCYFSFSASATEINSTLLTKYCSYCHGVPNPNSHTAREWRSVIFRMQTHRQKRGLKLLNAQEIDSLLQYLGEHTNKKAENK